jgi:hypothetical protein
MTEEEQERLISAMKRQARLRQAQLDQMYQDQLRDLGRAVLEKVLKGEHNGF